MKANTNTPTLAPNSIPARRRKLTLPVRDEAIFSPLEKLAAEAYFANLHKNEYSRVYDKSRKELFASMKAAAVEKFDFMSRNEAGTEIHLGAEISTPVGQAVDVAKLRKLITDEQFMAIVSATSAAVERVVGSSILNQVIVPKAGTENVSIGLLKA